MGSSSRVRWIVGRHCVGTPRVRLLCFAQSGGGAGVFSGWRKHLPEGLELAPVELPGRGTREKDPMPARFETLADQVFEALQPEMTLPYALFGHSLGAAMAYEVARRAELSGVRAPLATFASGMRAPFVPSLRTMSDASHEKLIGWLTANGGLPEELLSYPDYLENILRVIRADLRYAESYLVPEAPPLTCPLHAIGGTEDDVTPPVEIPRWERCAAGAFSVTMLPGGHTYPQTDPATTLAAITAVLAPVLQPLSA
jgi:surfactin synthase thioesterase subunit